jgi:arsenical pump membrane protein
LLLALLGVVGGTIALVFAARDATSAASQVWPPFVLVAGLLLVGLVADADGLFSAAGYWLTRLAPSGPALFLSAAVLVALVTAVLNLDTSVVFLTPVFVYAARGRGEDEAPFLYGCLLLSNAGSLLLPGSNLTNLIVLRHLQLSGGQFFIRMAPAWMTAVLITTAVIGIAERRSLHSRARSPIKPERPVLGLGLLAVTAVTVLVVVLRSPAVPVAVVGVLVSGVRLAARRERLDRVLTVLGVPVLLGLFGIAMTLGALGRAWSGPATLLSHVDEWGTAGVAAAASVLFNNLPAASLLAAKVPPRPFALLVGLNVGPNLFVTGSLAWILWLRTARAAGSKPSIRRASLLGLATAPLSIAGALGVLALTGSH